MWYRQWRSIFHLNVQVGDSLSGIRVVKAFGQEQVEKNRYEGANEAAVRQNIRVDGLWSAVFPLFSLLAGSGVLLTWYVGGVAVLQKRISLGVLMVIRIVQVRQHHDLWIWQLETDAGPMRMTMRNLYEQVQLHGANRLLLTDVNGRRAEIRDLQALDGASKKWIKDVL